MNKEERGRREWEREREESKWRRKENEKYVCAHMRTHIKVRKERKKEYEIAYEHF